MRHRYLLSSRLPLLAMGLCLARAAWSDVSLENLRAATHPDHTRVVIDLSAAAEFQITEQHGGKRLELTIADAAFASGLEATGIRQQLFAGTPIKHVYRSGAEDELRLVFELIHSLQPSVFALEPHSGRGHRIVVDLYEPAQSDKPPITLDSGTWSAERPAASTATLTAAAQSSAEARVKTTAPATVIDDTAARPPTPAGATTINTPTAMRFSATWEHEWAVESGSGETQKFESIVEPRIEFDVSDNMRITALARIRGDATGDLGPKDNSTRSYSDINGPLLNNEHAELSIREFYIDTQTGNALWRIGKQQVVWGEADGIKVMDVVNPQSFREFILDDFDDSRIPLWMVNVEMMTLDAGSLQLLWIPDTTYHEIAEQGSPFAFSSSLYIPVAPQGLAVRQSQAEKPDAIWSDSDAGVRYATFAGGWDISLNYLYHFQDLPVLYQDLEEGPDGPVGALNPEYERNHLLGATLSNVYGPITLRSELAYNSDTFHISRDSSNRGITESAEFASVLGLDWQWDTHNTLLSAQWFQSHLPDHEPFTRRTATEHTFSLLYQRNFNYDTWQIHALGLYSLDREDRWLNLKVSHMLMDNVELWLGGDFFAGDSDGLYGQFGAQDRVLVGVELGL